MNYKDNYKSIQINIPKDKYYKILEWLYEMCEEEGRSYNSFITQLIKREYEKYQKEKENKEKGDKS